MVHLALPHGLKLGDFVLVSEPGPARGLGRLDTLVEVDGETRLRVEFPGQGRSLLVSAEGARHLEEALSSTTAARWVAAFASGDPAPDDRPSEDQFVTSVKTLSRGPWPDVQRRLAILYASPWKATTGELRVIDMYESALVPILAHALGRDQGALVAELRAGKPVFSATRPRPLAPASEMASSPTLPGYESLFPFDVSGTLWLGERPDWYEMPAPHGLAQLNVAPGRWHSYRLLQGDDDDAVELLLLHETRLGEGASVVRSTPWKRAAEIIQVAGGRAVNVVDSAALTNEWTMDRVRYLGGVREYGGHAVCVATDAWRGPLPVFVSPEHGIPTMLRVPLLDEEDE